MNNIFPRRGVRYASIPDVPTNTGKNINFLDLRL